ncbi:MAG: 2OG-Fe(II) oxygenase family protein [Oceanicaulis sp.]
MARHRPQTFNALRLNPNIKIGKAAKAYARAGVAVIDDVLDDEDAAALAAAMLAEPGFNLVTRVNGEHRDFDAAAMAALPAERRAPFDALVARGARDGFQYLYETYPLYDAGKESLPLPGVFAGALGLICGDPFLSLAQQVCWSDQISFADGQLTRFAPGHFLTRHDDDVPAKNRVAAYVLQLSAGWRADHGGVLTLFGPDEEVRRGLTPGFNRLILFSVPRPHAVSMVTPFAPRPRLSVTGWLRTGAPD